MDLQGLAGNRATVAALSGALSIQERTGTRIVARQLSPEKEATLRAWATRRAGQLGLNPADPDVVALVDQAVDKRDDREFDLVVAGLETELRALQLRRNPPPPPPSLYAGAGAGPQEAAAKQALYLQRFDDACRDAVPMITEKPGSAVKVLNFLAATRQSIAKEVGSMDPGEFGKRREPSPFGALGGAKTPMTRQYAAYAVAQAEAMRTAPAGMVKPRGELGAPAIAYELQVTGTIGGKTIPLTTTVLGAAEYLDRTRMIDKARSLAVQQGEKLGMWEHTAPEYSGMILDHIDELQRSLFAQYEAGASAPELEKTLASISWWLTNAMPWKRGTAAINEMYLTALRLRLGLPAKKRKAGTSLDLEAFVRLEARYVADWSTFFS